ncbi:MAG: PAS domain-containing protein [Deltaproteobacteria bacterium]|nr:PAS domain-containing protein [Deltaproteobacteria bacterium]
MNDREVEEPLLRQIIGLGERSIRKNYYPQLQQRLIELERFRNLLDQTYDAIFVCRIPGFAIVDVNRAGCELLRLPRGMIEGIDLRPLFPDFDFHADEMTGIGRPAEATVVTHAMDSTGLTHPVELTFQQSVSKGASYGILVVREIGERLRQEEVQRSLEAQLYQSEKLRALGTLAGGIAHDFNNILTGILGHLRLLLDETNETDPRRARYDDILHLTRSAAGVTRQLLGFARHSEKPPRRESINPLLAQTADLFAHTQRSIGIHRAFAPNLPPVRIDAGQIEQVFLNLLLNAGQALLGTDAGEIYLSTDTVDLDRADAARLGLTPGLYVRATVRDTGSGMDDATRSRIFEPFFTTKARSHGTGLGLSSAYGIVAHHRGSIEVMSQPGQGATFSVYLPADLAEQSERGGTTGTTGATGATGASARNNT